MPVDGVGNNVTAENAGVVVDGTKARAEGRCGSLGRCAARPASAAAWLNWTASAALLPASSNRHLQPRPSWPAAGGHRVCSRVPGAWGHWRGAGPSTAGIGSQHTCWRGHCSSMRRPGSSPPAALPCASPALHHPPAHAARQAVPLCGQRQQRPNTARRQPRVWPRHLHGHRHHHRRLPGPGPEVHQRGVLRGLVLRGRLGRRRGWPALLRVSSVGWGVGG